MNFKAILQYDVQKFIIENLIIEKDSAELAA